MALLILHGMREGDNTSKSDNTREGNVRNGGGNEGKGSGTRGRVVTKRRVSTQERPTVQGSALAWEGDDAKVGDGARAAGEISVSDSRGKKKKTYEKDPITRV